jgi:hypothetical protein
MGKRSIVADPHVDALQKELMTIKEQVTGAKMFKAKEGAPTFPFPIVVTLTVPKPPSANAFDIDSLTLKLTFDAGAPCAEDNSELSVEPADDLPCAVAEAIGASLSATWKQQLVKRREAAGAAAEQPGWLLKGLVTLVSAKFAQLLQSRPECVEEYQGCDDLGATLRRYMLVPPLEASDASSRGSASGESDGDSSDGEGSGEEEMDDEARAFWEAQERRKAEAARALAIKETNDAEARRQEVERLRAKGVDVEGPKLLSKKEQDEAHARKRGQGNRLAKTGSRASKFAGEGSALAKDADKKKKAK